jgi:hypothetical protein
VRQDLRHIHHVERSPCHRPPAPSRREEASCLTDDQARTDTHAIPKWNNVTPPTGNYVLTSRPQLGNYVIADILRPVAQGVGHKQRNVTEDG